MSQSKKQRVSIWERHDSRFGYSTRLWCLAGTIFIMNMYWFVLTTIMSRDAYVKKFGIQIGILRAISYGASQAVLLDTSFILFLVLRRSMLHAIGFTYAEIIPVHRWLGVAMLWWATVHSAFYSAYLIIEGEFVEDIAFTDKARGTRNMPGVIAWFGVVIMSFFALPLFRRKIYPVFLYIHRAGTFVFFFGLIMHYPSVMLWYYMLPGFVLFLVDRFVPKIIQGRSISPEATCTYNADADIIRVKFTSPEPMKPYYPGDYINVRVPGMGHIYHPFTIASYWPEDPYSITLYMRIFGESRFSWTKDLAKRCGNDGKSIILRANVDGVFGDRHHDYLNSETVVIFTAGTAITTFMALIKAIAAHIADSNVPLHLKLHLICTFRTRSELHAYGSFLHQITRDIRFTSWLHVEVYVSRPDKHQTLIGSHAHIVQNDILVPGTTKKNGFLKRSGTALKRAFSGKTFIGSSPNTEKSQHQRSNSDDSIPNVLQGAEIGIDASTNLEAEKSVTIDTPESLSSPISNMPTEALTYQEHPLPTFQASDAAAVSTRLAVFDLLTSAVLVAVPLAAYYCMRAVHWEGGSLWCVTATKKDKWTIFVCHWTYALLPGVFHTLIMLALGFAGVAMARKAHIRHHQLKANNMDIESIAAANSSEKLQHRDTSDGNWDEGDVVYSRSRMDVGAVIGALVQQGVGKKEAGRGLTTVFAGGPDGFIEMVEKQVKKADWVVEFHRETWSP
ncbi:hypothetical protein BGZ76_010294 [Entomortierella beljakovae]|nr:hypothetical protein BGZ76_010294 [Entomortierella beljakovae]